MTTQQLSRNGHRARVREQLLKNGIANLPEYQVVEYLLFQGIPYKDTKEMAYDLINRYGNLSGICNASIDSLMEIRNMTFNAALFFKMLSQISERLEEEIKSSDKTTLGSVKKILAFLGKIIDPLKEICYIINVNNEENVIGVHQLTEGTENSLTISTRLIIRTLLEINAQRIIIVHNHPSGQVRPSKEDLENSYSTHRMLKAINVELIDHMIIYGNHAYSVSTRNEYEFKLIPKGSESDDE